MSKNISFQISNMNCGACERKIRTALTDLSDEGVEFSLSFNIPAKELKISFDPAQAQALTFKKTIEEAGFQISKMEQA